MRHSSDLHKTLDAKLHRLRLQAALLIQNIDLNGQECQLVTARARLEQCSRAVIALLEDVQQIRRRANQRGRAKAA